MNITDEIAEARGLRFVDDRRKRQNRSFIAVLFLVAREFNRSIIHHHLLEHATPVNEIAHSNLENLIGSLWRTAIIRNICRTRPFRIGKLRSKIAPITIGFHRGGWKFVSVNEETRWVGSPSHNSQFHSCYYRWILYVKNIPFIFEDCRVKYSSTGKGKYREGNWIFSNPWERIGSTISEGCNVRFLGNKNVS